MSEAEAEKLRQAYALLQSHKMLPHTPQPRVTVSNRSDRAAPSATSARDPLAGLSRSPMQTRPRNHGLMWDLPDGGDNLAVLEPPPRATSTGSIAAVTQGSNQAGGRTPQSSPAVPLDVTRMVPLPCPSHAPFEQPANVGPVSVPTVPNPRQGQAEAQAQAQAGAVSGRHQAGAGNITGISRHRQGQAQAQAQARAGTRTRRHRHKQAQARTGIGTSRHRQAQA